MPVPSLEPELVEHLRVEFGEHGSRAVEFLETARRLLEAPTVSGPRLGETVAYQCREALESIAEAGRPGVRSPWRELSREVVKSADRYVNAAQTHDEDAAQLLREMLSRIDEVRRFHDEGDRRHQQQLIAMIVERAGVPPSEGSGVVSAFQDLFDRLNDALHGDCPVALAREMYGECVALVRRLFMPMESRDSELRSLAAVESPTRADVQRLLELVATPVHMAQFVRSMATSQWLVQLDAARVFDQEHIEVWWAIAAAAQRLGPTHAESVSGFLSRLWNRNDKDPERLRCVADAARRMGLAGAPLMLEVLKRHPDNGAVVFEALQVATELDPSTDLVADFVDLLFNEACWPHLFMPEELADHLVEGIDEHNAHARVRLVCFKLRAGDPDDFLLGQLRWDHQGTLTEFVEPMGEERSPVLVSCLVSALRRAWELVPIRDLLETLRLLPDGLRERARAWVLSEVPDVDPELLVSEVAGAVGARLITGDDAAVVDRAVQSAPADGLARRWKRALGEPPSVEQLGQAMAADSVPREWLCRSSWVRFLPDDATSAWRNATQLIEARYGALDRDYISTRRRAEAFVVTSPFTEDELGALSPEQASVQIAAWRAGPQDWDHGPRELARTLQRVVQQAPHDWLSDPVGLAAKLYHPTYISAYLLGIKEALPDSDVPVKPLLDVIALVDTSPWNVEPLADSPRDFETDWRSARRAGIDLIAAMAVADVQFGDRSDQAWNLLLHAAIDTSAESWAQMDSLTRAINRDCTRAFDAAVLFVAAELRSGKPVRAEFAELMRFALTREGNDGEEFRAIVARRLAWLRNSMADWADDNFELIFGDDAPADLAQLTVDLAIRWGWPHRWLFETVPDMVRDAVLRDVDEAIDHLMIAMLGDWPGFQLDDIVRFIVRNLDEYPDLASRAGISMSRIVSHDDIEERYLEPAVRLWEELLDSPAASALAGFGNMHRAAALDEQRWAQLTQRTLADETNRGRWLYGAANRAMQLPPTQPKLAMLNAIVRGHMEPGTRYRISADIGEVLAQSTGLEDSDEYRLLVIALREHDIIRDEPEEDS